MTFKHIALTAAWLMLSPALAAPVFAGPVETFQGLCMAHLEDVAGLRRAAQAQGFDLTDLSPTSFMGMRDSSDESIQVNAFTRAAFECAVTTSDVADPEALRAQFFTALGISTKKSQVKAKIQGRSYAIKFDTKGGEALVIAR